MGLRVRVRLVGLVRVLDLHRLDFPAALRWWPMGKVAAPGLAGVRMGRIVVRVAGVVVACVGHRPVSE